MKIRLVLLEPHLSVKVRNLHDLVVIVDSRAEMGLEDGNEIWVLRVEVDVDGVLHCIDQEVRASL